MAVNIDNIPTQPFGARLLKQYAEALEKQERLTHDTSVTIKANAEWVVNGVTIKGRVTREPDYEQSIRHKRPPKLVEAVLLDVIADLVPAGIYNLFLHTVKETLDKVDASEAYEEYMKSQAKNVDMLRVLIDAQKDLTITQCKGQTKCKGVASISNDIATLSLDKLRQVEEELGIPAVGEGMHFDL